MSTVFVVRTSQEILPVGYLKGQYKSESSLMAFEAELHGWVSRMARPVVTLIGSCVLVRKQVIVNIIVPLDHLSETR